MQTTGEYAKDFHLHVRLLNQDWPGLSAYTGRLHKVDQSIQLATFMFFSLFVRSQWNYPNLLEIPRRSGKTYSR